MKLKHVLLGIALVALVAACGKKETPVETPTETAVETPVVAVETPTETVAAPVQEKKAPAKKEATKKEAKKETAKKEAPKADPCAATVADYESFSLRISSAYKNKGTGAAAIKEYAALKKDAAAKEAAVKGCAQNPTYKARVAQAIVNVKKVL